METPIIINQESKATLQALNIISTLAIQNHLLLNTIIEYLKSTSPEASEKIEQIKTTQVQVGLDKLQEIADQQQFSFEVDIQKL